MKPKHRAISPNSIFIAVSSASLLLSAMADVSEAGSLTLHGDQTVSTYQLDGGVLTGTGTLTVTNGVTLNGGTVYASLSGETTSSGNVEVYGFVGGGGFLGGGSLSITSGTLTVSGTSNFSNISNTPVSITSGATLSVASLNGLGHDVAMVNAGTLTLVGSEESLATYTQNAGGLMNGYRSLTALDHATLHGGTIAGTLNSPAITSDGNVIVTGSLSGGELIFNNGHWLPTPGGTLSVTAGTLSVRGGYLGQALVEISRGATLVASGMIDQDADVINGGNLIAETRQVIGDLINNGGIVNAKGQLLAFGSAVFNGGLLAGRFKAVEGTTLNDGTSVMGILEGNTTTHGRVGISGTLRKGDLQIATGILSLTEGELSNTTIAAGATLRGTGRVIGALANTGTLEIGSAGTGSLQIIGSLVTNGTIALDLESQTDFDRIEVIGNARFGGKLVITNTGSELVAGEVVRLIDATSYEGTFGSVDTVGFENPVLFNDSTGELLALTMDQTGSTRTFLNLNRSQTSVYLALFEDAVDIGIQNVTIGSGSARQTVSFGKSPAQAGIHFTSQNSNGDPQLVEALNAATFTTPGSIFQPVINRLSPEVHRGMADYSEQAMRSHMEEGMDTAAAARTGKTQIFGSLRSSDNRVDSSATEAGYDLDLYGLTSGVRYDIDKRFQIGGLLGMDEGNIKGLLIDTDAQGLVIGAFGRFLVDEAGKTTLSASLSYGSYDYDSNRHGFGGDATAEDIGSDAIELAIGARSISFEKQGFRVIPNAALRYMTGSVDQFTESGAGVGLRVGSQDIDSLLLDLGVDFQYPLQKQVTLIGSLGYTNDFMDSGNSLSGGFTASGALGSPFHVSAPGIDDEAFVLGLGAFYDINDRARVGLTCRSEFHMDSEYSQNIGVSASFGF